MKTLLLSVVLLAGCSSLMPQDQSLNNTLIAIAPAIAEIQAHGCVSSSTLTAITTAACVPSTGVTTTGTGAINTNNCVFVTLATSFFPANKICPTTVAVAPVTAPAPVVTTAPVVVAPSPVAPGGH